MVLEEAIVEYLAQFADVREEVREGGEHESQIRLFYRGEKVFLAIEAETQPLRLEIRCDRRLSKTLQERYESVMAGRLLGRNGTEIICSGQLSDEEVIDLVRHSYEKSAEE